MRGRWRLTVRVRLTLLYSGLFAACGVILVAITYGLLAANLPEPKSRAGAAKVEKPVIPVEFAEDCANASKNPDADPAVLYKCKAAYQEGVLEGAATQREATLDQLLRYSLGTLAAVTLLAAAAGWIVAGRVLRPVHRITEAARNASDEHLSARQR